jgi:glycosyltransferase involved in cell wall biosynthesis
MGPLVSIITPNYNASKYIAATIKSVQNQTYSNWELLIVDDCSTDNSIEIIKKLQQVDKRIKLLELPQNVGPAIVRNKGIKQAQGNYLTFIDSDDIWLPNFIETSLNKVKDTEGFVFASYHRFNEELEHCYKDFIVPAKVNYSDILKSNSISCLTAFIDIDKLGKLYMPEILYRQDMGLWLQYLKKIEVAIGIKQPLAIYRIRKKSHSRNKLNLLKHQWKFYRNVTHLSILKSGYYFCSWIFFGVRKYYF